LLELIPSIPTNNMKNPPANMQSIRKKETHIQPRFFALTTGCDWTGGVGIRGGAFSLMTQRKLTFQIIYGKGLFALSLELG